MRVGSSLQVSFDRLAENISLLKKMPCHDKKILFMVKANAYGHGIVPITHFANKEMDIRCFGTASIAEAVFLRQSLSNNQFDIYIFSELELKETASQEAILDHRLIPVLSTRHDLLFFLKESTFKNVPLCLKFNIGMNRLGLDDLDETIDLILKSGRKSIFHVMGHFACSSFSMNEHDSNVEQQNYFEKIKKTVKSKGLSIERSSVDNSGAILQKQDFLDSHIRPGLMLYGPSPLDESLREKNVWSGKMISQLETTILKTFKTYPNMPIGYNGTLMDRQGFLAVIALGYGDGLFTSFQGVKISHKGFLGEFVGRVNMDMAQILFPLDVQNKIKDGEKIIIWNEDSNCFLNLSQQANHIPYEILCGISSRVPRVYL